MPTPKGGAPGSTARTLRTGQGRAGQHMRQAHAHHRHDAWRLRRLCPPRHRCMVRHSAGPRPGAQAMLLPPPHPWIMVMVMMMMMMPAGPSLVGSYAPHCAIWASSCGGTYPNMAKLRLKMDAACARSSSRERRYMPSNAAGQAGEGRGGGRGGRGAHGMCTGNASVQGTQAPHWQLGQHTHTCKHRKRRGAGGAA